MSNDMWCLLAAAKRAIAAVAFVSALVWYPGGCFAQQKTANMATRQESYKYDTAGVRLEGRLIERKVYGPPGYGETPAKDQRSSIFVLKLPAQSQWNHWRMRKRKTGQIWTR
jgi:hypothetical protein